MLCSPARDLVYPVPLSVDRTFTIPVITSSDRDHTQKKGAPKREPLRAPFLGRKLQSMSTGFNLCSLIVIVWFLKMIVSFWLKKCSIFLLFHFGMVFQHVSFHFLGISFHAKIETWRGGGQVRTKKTCCNSNNKYHDYRTKQNTYTQ